MTNYSSAHESLSTEIGSKRFNYPPNHIEADNRLSWLLGRLDKTYGNNAFYVHLKRNSEASIRSFSRRIDYGILKAFEQGVLMHEQHLLPANDIAGDYIETVETNIELFLKDKTNKLNVSLETAKTDFARFWEEISAQGNLSKALKEWETNYNAS
jgi:hypothetical protein